MPVKEHTRVERRTDMKVYAHGWLRETDRVLGWVSIRRGHESYFCGGCITVSRTA